MRLELNGQQLDAMFRLISALLKTYPAEDNAERLLNEIVEGIRIKMRNKLDTLTTLKTPKSYSLALKPYEAYALEIWVASYMPAINTEELKYEFITTTGIYNQLDQAYGQVRAAGPGAHRAIKEA